MKKLLFLFSVIFSGSLLSSEVISKDPVVKRVNGTARYVCPYCQLCNYTDYTIRKHIKNHQKELEVYNFQQPEEQQRQTLKKSLKIYVPKEEPYEMIDFQSVGLPSLERSMAIYLYGFGCIPPLLEKK